MKKKELIIVAIVAAIIGTLMHFAYAWLGHSRFVGFFFPVDESVWEHMKMVFYPLLLVAIYTAIRKKDIGWISGTIWASLLAFCVHICLYYIYRIFTQRSVLLFDIIIYYIVMISAVFFGYKWSSIKKVRELWTLFAGISVVMILLFAYLTYNKPSILPSLFIQD